ncbi:hypothetical protein GCM10023210_33000 [Chryseobacterium ginsengisoli]|uniref:DUF4919 domain-containing protein n=1 Tax=Chryseobacterium ginsengisoli TaxID=363853 RepID=A0ABP9MJI9_9FLAO
MRKIIFVLIVLIGFKSFSQKKTIYYFDENQKQITKEEFDKRDFGRKTGYLKGYFSDIKNANTEVAMIFRALEKGVLSKEIHKEVIDYINKLTDEGIDEEYTIAICYFFRPVNMDAGIIEQQFSNSSYTGFFREKNKKVFIFFMTEKGYQSDVKNVYEDKEGKIKDLFFKYPFEYGNYIAIRPDGSFQKRIEKYNYHEILNFIKNKDN